MSNYVSSNIHWALLGEDSGDISTIQLDPLESTTPDHFKKCHGSSILDMKPLISNPHDNVEFYLTSSMNSIKKWKVEA